MAGLAVLIPALNCADTITDVVSGARRYVDVVVVVSDGSTDATAERAAAADAEVTRHPTTQGKGTALQTGLQLLADRGFARVLTMDGDGQHLSDQIPILLRASDAEPAALIIGAREFVSTSVAPIRLFGNRFANRWVEIACGQALPDTQSGFRVYPVRETLALGAHARHFAFETEVLIRAARAGLPIRSVPVQVYYPPVGEHTSHYRRVVDTVRIIFVVLGLIFRLW
ncbi:MAG: glycosyltransferase family 2 protein [Candidatus Binatia bacterium]